MALFVNQNEQRTQLQAKIESSLRERTKVMGFADGSDRAVEMALEDSQPSTNRSLLWAAIVAAIVVACVVFVLVIFRGV